MKYRFAFLGIALALFLSAQCGRSLAADGGINPSYGYAWSNFGGYVNFHASSSDVQVSDTAITGYAWSAHDGWIRLDPSQSGVRNDGAGNLSGYAWSTQVGWINFDAASIDTEGRFHGSAVGPMLGGTRYMINFDCIYCDVRTYWTAPSGVSSGSTSGGGRFLSSVVTQNSTDDQPVSLSCIYPSSRLKNGDTNSDAKVDVLDFNRLMVQWGRVSIQDADLNQDCVVDVLDFNQLMVRWTL